ncbi:MAG: MogA/MoaB family molybdenum cofactor biosynthesis protein [Candidatus Aminicenantia bacterium]
MEMENFEISEFKISAGVIAISDRCFRKEREDLSGALLKELIEKELKGEVIFYKIVPDEWEQIKEAILSAVDVSSVDLLITTGGTGLSKRDITPDVTSTLIEKEALGISEIMRVESFKNNPFSVLSRGICGLRKGTLIINLPGSPKSVKECFSIILPLLIHAIKTIKGIPDFH